MIECLIITAMAAVNIALIILLIIQRMRYRHIRKITKTYKDHTREIKSQNKILKTTLYSDYGAEDKWTEKQ